jgi:murein DD-endopeptidase MepM/ murein hydrolase activator NlpD
MKTVFSFLRAKFKHENFKGFSKNPFFYFGVMSVVLFGVLCMASGSLAGNNYLQKTDSLVANPFFNTTDAATSDNLFAKSSLALETPDLKIIQDNSVSAISTPGTLNTQSLGDIFGTPEAGRKEVIDYTVELGDTVDSVAAKFGISSNTVLWANELSKGSTLKVGDSVIILPVSGVIHIVKSGDTVEQIAKTYKAKVDDIVLFNNLANSEDIFIGDTLLIPDGLMPSKSAPPINIQVPLPQSSFIYPLLHFSITQGLHYFNAIDIQPVPMATACGQPVYASAEGVIQRAIGDGGWHSGMGNHITILHANGVVTYYGHLMKVLVSPGQHVSIGQQIGLVGGQPGMLGAGDSTGCHVHFQVVGARNPLAGIMRGTVIDVNK